MGVLELVDRGARRVLLLEEVQGGVRWGALLVRVQQEVRLLFCLCLGRIRVGTHRLHLRRLLLLNPRSGDLEFFHSLGVFSLWLGNLLWLNRSFLLFSDDFAHRLPESVQFVVLQMSALLQGGDVSLLVLALLGIAGRSDEELQTQTVVLGQVLLILEMIDSVESVVAPAFADFKFGLEFTDHSFIFDAGNHLHAVFVFLSLSRQTFLHFEEN